MGDPARAKLDVKEFRQMLKQALADLARAGVLPDDIRLEHLRVVKRADGYRLRDGTQMRCSRGVCQICIELNQSVCQIVPSSAGNVFG
jgi:hypothetical protein